MAELKNKIQNVMDESRMLVLGAEILHNCGFTSSECCDLCGNWIDTLVFWGNIFQSLLKALAKLADDKPPALTTVLDWPS